MTTCTTTLDPVSLRATQRSIAVHEAGHAVAAWYAACRGYNEQRFSRVWMRRTADAAGSAQEFSLGAIDHTESAMTWSDSGSPLRDVGKLQSDLQVCYLRYAEADLFVSLAGPMAELRHSEGCIDHWSDAALDDISNAICHPRRGFGCCGNVSRIDGELRYFELWERRGSVLPRLIRRAARFLERSAVWALVMETAHAIECRDLSFDDIVKIAGGRFDKLPEDLPPSFREF